MNDRISALLKEKHINNKNVNVMAKSILITGAGGTVGEALARFLLERYCDKTVILLDHSDSALNVCYKNLNKYKNAHFYIGDYADAKMFNWLIRKYNVDTVFHCAAYKIVPMVDLNPVSAFENNTEKSNKLFRMCGENKIQNCIFMSSYEAFISKNIFGDTKRIAEILLEQNSTKYPDTKYCALRFGFVLNSSGSVIYLFEEQARKGENITVTHKEVERYVRSVDEVVDGAVVLLEMGETGCLYTLNMKKPIKIYELAKYYQMKYNERSKIVITQLRPGDKIYEEPLGCENGFSTSLNNQVFKNNKIYINWNTFNENYSKLIKNIESENYERIYDLIRTCTKNIEVM